MAAKGTFRLACVQVNSQDDMEANIAAAEGFARAAAKDGARLIAFPENVAFMAPDGKGVREAARGEDAHPALARFRALAAGARRMAAGGLARHRRADATGRVANRSFVIDSGGNVVTRYDKIHMFDVDLPGGESYREFGDLLARRRGGAGGNAVGRLGLTVCYDLRFPHLYRALARAGAELLSVPSAFTLTDREGALAHAAAGPRHRERRFVFAPAQCGDPSGGRKTYGHSLIVDPWGEVLADGGEAPGFVAADIDLAMVAQVRARIPSLTHDRDFAGPV